MIVPDTSVLVATFAPWHESHARANERVGIRCPLIAHTAFEFVSTVTRLPDPYRVAAAPAVEFLAARTDEAWLVLDSQGANRTLARSVEAGVHGGALYDALVAATAGRPRRHAPHARPPGRIDLPQARCCLRADVGALRRNLPGNLPRT